MDQRKIIVLLYAALLMPIVIAVPALDYVAPTLANNSYTGDDTFVDVNVSLQEENLDDLVYNWNGTNYTYYNASLLLLYNLDNISVLGEAYNSSGATILDFSSYQNNATINSLSQWNATGYYGGALVFDGTDSIVLANSTSLNSTDPITISLWMKTGNIGDITTVNGMMVFGRGIYGDPINTMEIRLSNAEKVQFGYEYGSGTNSRKATSITSMNDSVWHFVAGVWNTSDCLMYVDGNLENYTSCPNTPGPFDQAFVIGGNLSGNFDLLSFVGTIDEIRIWNQSLSSAEIYQQYTGNLNKFNETQWYLYVNQSENASLELANGNYTYFVAAKNSSGDETLLGTQVINVGSEPQQSVPEFSDYALFILLLVVVGGFFRIKRGHT